MCAVYIVMFALGVFFVSSVLWLYCNRAKYKRSDFRELTFPVFLVYLLAAALVWIFGAVSQCMDLRWGVDTEVTMGYVRIIFLLGILHLFIVYRVVKLADIERKPKRRNGYV